MWSRDYSGLVMTNHSSDAPHSFPEGHVHVYLCPEFAPQPTHATYKLGRSYDGTFTISDEVRVAYTNQRVRLTAMAMTNDHHMYSHDGKRPISDSIVFEMLGLSPRSPPAPPAPPAPPFSPPEGMRRKRSRRLDDDSDPTIPYRDTLQPDVHSFRDGRMYVVGRGPSPVSAVAASNVLSSAVPGLYSFTVTNCTSISFTASDTVVPVDAAKSVHTSPDPHGGDFVGDHEFWIIDQTGSGHGVTCASDPLFPITYLDKSTLA